MRKKRNRAQDQVKRQMARTRMRQKESCKQRRSEVYQMVRDVKKSNVLAGNFETNNKPGKGDIWAGTTFSRNGRAVPPTVRGSWNKSLYLSTACWPGVCLYTTSRPLEL